MEALTRLCIVNAKPGVLLKNSLCLYHTSRATNGVCMKSPAPSFLLLTESRTKEPQQQVRYLTTSPWKFQKNEPLDPPDEDVRPMYHDESLPHFRHSLARKKEMEDLGKEPKTQDSDANKSVGAAPSVRDTALHPDVEEALGMHEGGYRLPHPVWNSEELECVRITHRPPETRTDRLAYNCVMTLRRGFDLFSGYTWGNYRGTLDEKQWLKRIIFLETVAGVPGMVGAMVRHLISLRRMKRDHGWIHTLLEEAENERMHLMTAMRVANPGILMRGGIMIAQGLFVPTFSIAYLISPRFCHRFVGYLEEEAVKTYTNCLKAIDEGELKMWCRMKAPEIAVEYWKLPEDAMMRDVILAIRADEAHHRAVNHTLSSKKSDDKNPYKPGE